MSIKYKLMKYIISLILLILRGNKNPLISLYPLVNGSKIQWHPTKYRCSVGSLGSGSERKQ